MSRPLARRSASTRSCGAATTRTTRARTRTRSWRCARCSTTGARPTCAVCSRRTWPRCTTSTSTRWHRPPRSSGRRCARSGNRSTRCPPNPTRPCSATRLRRRSRTVLMSLADPDLFLAGPPHELLTELRATTPVAWQEMDGEPGFFAVLKHADVVSVARQPNLYSASEGGVVLEDLDEGALEMMRGMLLAMDPPRHGDHRRPLADSFKGKVI